MQQIVTVLLIAAFCLAFVNCQTTYQPLYSVKPDRLSIIKWGPQVYHFLFDYVPNYDLEYILIDKCLTAEVFQPLYDKHASQMMQLYYQQINLNSKLLKMPQIPWDIMKYESGKMFVAHCDKLRPINNKVLHIGTQILIPPLPFNTFKNGSLILYEGQQYIEILPDQKYWTYVIVPLGVRHEVKTIDDGFRVSYRRSFYIQHRDFGQFSKRTCGEQKANATKRIPNVKQLEKTSQNQNSQL